MRRSRRTSSTIRGAECAGIQRQPYPYLRELAQGGFDIDQTAVPGNDIRRQGQPQAGARADTPTESLAYPQFDVFLIVADAYSSGHAGERGGYERCSDDPERFIAIGVYGQNLVKTADREHCGDLS